MRGFDILIFYFTNHINIIMIPTDLRINEIEKIFRVWEVIIGDKDYGDDGTIIAFV